MTTVLLVVRSNRGHVYMEYNDGSWAFPTAVAASRTPRAAAHAMACKLGLLEPLERLEQVYLPVFGAVEVWSPSRQMSTSWFPTDKWLQSASNRSFIQGSAIWVDIESPLTLTGLHASGVCIGPQAAAMGLHAPDPYGKPVLPDYDRMRRESLESQARRVDWSLVGM
jgi:hypothetical protein